VTEKCFEYVTSCRFQEKKNRHRLKQPLSKPKFEPGISRLMTKTASHVSST